MVLITTDGNSEKDVKRGIEHTSQAVGMWRNRGIIKKCKIKIYKAMTHPIFVYGSEL